MKPLSFKYSLVLATLLAVWSCSVNKMEPYDQPFVVFTYTNSSSTSIDELAQTDAQYYIHLSSRRLDTPVSVTVSAIPGNGLQEGGDYEFISQGGTVTFYPGIYDMPFRIRWLANEIDETKDNTLTLRLESSDLEELSLGMPGPDEVNRTLRITKYKLD